MRTIEARTKESGSASAPIRPREPTLATSLADFGEHVLLLERVLVVILAEFTEKLGCIGQRYGIDVARLRA